MQKGFAQLLIIIPLVLLLIAGGIYFYPKTKKENTSPTVVKTEITESVNDTSGIKEYSNQNLGFSFQYPKELSVKEDTEEEFNKRGNGDFRKNFRSYIEYEPGGFVGAVVVLEDEQDYDANPLTLWVFDNSDDLTIEDWHDKYWYYPFVWGDFSSRGKIDYAPTEISTISGQLTKSKVLDYQPNKPKFVYLENNKKMYLFRVVGLMGEEILETINLEDVKQQNNVSYTCPENGWENCMPILTPEAQKQCTQEALIWKKLNCSNFQGSAL